jgi:hypothetical protein
MNHVPPSSSLCEALFHECRDGNKYSVPNIHTRVFRESFVGSNFRES